MLNHSTTTVGDDTSIPAPAIKRDYLADVVLLSAVQLQAAIDYIGSRESHCTGALLDVVGAIAGIRGMVAQTSVATLPRDIDGALRSLTKDADEAVVALQFVDALRQRLSHILFELHQIADLADSGVDLDSTDAWKDLLGRIRAMYSIHEERVVFDAVIANAPIGKLLDADGARPDDDGDDVELF